MTATIKNRGFGGLGDVALKYPPRSDELPMRTIAVLVFCVRNLRWGEQCKELIVSRSLLAWCFGWCFVDR